MKILITGASGLVGKQLIPSLLDLGYDLVIISRTSNKRLPGINNIFSWQQLQSFPEEIIKDVDIIIHLAGASIAQGRWTKARKRKIINSRVQTAQLLFDAATTSNINLKLYISASAVGYYPYSNTHLFTEDDKMGTGFLSDVCNMWELSATNFKNKETRTVVMRLGSILSKDGGMLKPIIKAINLGLGAKMGNGKQYIPWVSINDVVRFVLFAIENKSIDGTYNVVAPQIIDNKTLILSLKKALHKKSLIPFIPKILIKLLFGKKSELLLKGQKVSSQKIISNRFTFIYPNLNIALEHLL